jgi:hypothetical protein
MAAVEHLRAYDEADHSGETPAQTALGYLETLALEYVEVAGVPAALREAMGNAVQYNAQIVREAL